MNILHNSLFIVDANKSKISRLSPNTTQHAHTEMRFADQRMSIG